MYLESAPDDTAGLCQCLSAQIIHQVGLHTPRSAGSCSVSGHTHWATACLSLGLNKRTANLQRSWGCDGPTQAPTFPPLSVPYRGETWALKGHLWSEPVCFQKKRACSWLFFSPYPFPTLLKTAVMYLFLKNMQQCLWDGTCSWHVPKKQWVQRQQLKVGGHFSEKTSTWDTKHLIPNGLGVPVTANGATVNWKCQRQGADFWSQLGGQITAAEAASPGGGGEVLSITLSSVHKSELSSVETLPYQIPPAAISCRGLRLL